ncbi:ATP-binding protein [Kitasatospora phosalacinea]|uniref:ATP-binding protein n=1 Tax=Kitasatospora phosalacinea TaxID=2065 RepID=UPI0035E0ECA6
MDDWPEIPVARTAARGAGAPPRSGTARTAAEPAPAGPPAPPTASFAARKPRRSLDDLVVSEEVRERVDLALRQLDHHHVLYRDWNLRRIDPDRTGTAVNFYGPPGTGKSLAAEAVAHHRGAELIDVNYAEIESKYVGDTPKNIVACFEEAQHRQAVLVFNEADSILGSRLSSVTQSSDHSVNVSRAVMLSQLDRFDGLVVFTTNFPRNYDAAFVRRILVHVRFDLPDESTLRRLWTALVPEEVPGRAELDVAQLAAASAGLAGGDLVNAVKAGAARAVVRTGAERALRTADLLAELAVLRRAKAEVGKPAPGTARVLSVEHLDRLPGQDAPEEGTGASAGQP